MLPSPGKLELNTNGCFYESINKAGYGGVLRDSSGKWVLGYYGKATSTSSLEVEIWAIYRGLTVIFKKGISSVILEFDSSVTVNFCNEGPPPDHPWHDYGVVGISYDVSRELVTSLIWAVVPKFVTHPQRHIIEEVRRLAGGTNSIITHIYRQANQTADCLARLGSQQEDDLIVTSSIPFAAREFALADAMGVGHLRT
ncbi:uncharacterized protein LOC131321348 [Rhododendron vialii]|uniref:uncharacterized protein LOC131321348 n=1 Tax=Rhododendron vialii TaxID=182163 RepID=UPI00265FA9A7|nr:uncharacterized protein LOC131321348 [Rhododendron vialii]